MATQRTDGTNDPQSSFFPGVDVDLNVFGLNGAICGCWDCVMTFKKDQSIAERMSMPFIVCPDCGNKRCPKATQHDNPCTGSNDPQQAGSRYGGL